MYCTNLLWGKKAKFFIDPPVISFSECAYSIQKSKKKVRHLEIESRANPWKGLMLPLHQWRCSLRNQEKGIFLH